MRRLALPYIAEIERQYRDNLSLRVILREHWLATFLEIVL